MERDLRRWRAPRCAVGEPESEPLSDLWRRRLRLVGRAGAAPEVPGTLHHSVVTCPRFCLADRRQGAGAGVGWLGEGALASTAAPGPLVSALGAAAAMGGELAAGGTLSARLGPGAGGPGGGRSWAPCGPLGEALAGALERATGARGASMLAVSATGLSDQVTMSSGLPSSDRGGESLGQSLRSASRETMGASRQQIWPLATMCCRVGPRGVPNRRRQRGQPNVSLWGLMEAHVFRHCAWWECPQGAIVRHKMPLRSGWQQMAHSRLLSSSSWRAAGDGERGGAASLGSGRPLLEGRVAEGLMPGGRAAVPPGARGAASCTPGARGGGGHHCSS